MKALKQFFDDSINRNAFGFGFVIFNDAVA
jgi:hypothetical protein